MNYQVLAELACMVLALSSGYVVRVNVRIGDSYIHDKINVTCLVQRSRILITVDVRLEQFCHEIIDKQSI